MNQTTFEELVKDSSLLNKDTQSELEQLLKEYPFCQTFHLLYTKNLYQQKHIRYHQQLKVAASVAGDRTRLKHYIEDTNLPVEVAKEQPLPVIEVKVETNPVVKKEFSLNPFQYDLVPEILIPEDIYVEEEEKSKSDTTSEWDADYEKVLLSTLDIEVSKEEKKKAIIALINKKFSELTVVVEENVPIKETVPPVPEENPEAKTEEVTIDQNIETFIEEPEEVKVKEVTASHELIDKFLRDAPRMPRPKKEFYNPVNFAARSIEENEDFYTETYASICFKQGNALKAIKIYEKLSLKFPEKSSYFAALIEKIKEEQNI
jgi:hypothetical protein